MDDQPNQKTGLEVPAATIEAYDGGPSIGGYCNEPVQVFRNKFTAHNDLRQVVSGLTDGYSRSLRSVP